MLMTSPPPRLNTKANVLIACEDPLEALALETILKTDGFGPVRLTTDMREVHPLYERLHFDVLIVDMNETFGDGLGLIRQFSPMISTNTLSVVALINPGAEQARMAALVAGAHTSLKRPLDRESTVHTVTQAQKLVGAGALQAVNG